MHGYVFWKVQYNKSYTLYQNLQSTGWLCGWLNGISSPRLSMVCGWDSSPIQISNGRGKSPKFLVELTDLNR